MFRCTSVVVKRTWTRRVSTSAQPHGYWPKKGDKVIIGMSGGVDSSVVARLLANEDYDLSAVFMRNWDTRDELATDSNGTGCEWEKDWKDVQAVCKLLDIPCQMIDLTKQYWNRVFEPALRVWESGQTPNPDVWCNREIKFGELLEHLPDQKSWFATGHYARKGWSMGDPPRPLLLRSADPLKDQSYYMSTMPEAGLARSIFPIGHLTKRRVIELAHEYNLPTADRPESMGLCFVGERGKFHDFLNAYIQPKDGPVVDMETGRRVGTHTGLWTLTEGQKPRLRGMPEKMYVTHKDPKTNTVYIARGGHPALLRDTFRPTDWEWLWKDTPPEGFVHGTEIRGTAKIRHRMPEVPCTLRSIDGGGLEVILDEAQTGVAPGQAVSMWDSMGAVLGSGTIPPPTHVVAPALDVRVVKPPYRSRRDYQRKSGPKPVLPVSGEHAEGYDARRSKPKQTPFFPQNLPPSAGQKSLPHTEVSSSKPRAGQSRASAADTGLDWKPVGMSMPSEHVKPPPRRRLSGINKLERSYERQQ
ncbi:hypothetical protein CYLTODRAFT_419774 [Cylindrobasidium torrendii FP15055 ss-10]|uniref:tRNA-5-taurinomethyluridine 2-sulfurtransferase n=1 Tax=Cylindrobasidium torrendii FP15055 ss-10 TaxID=1314674 RepID=A0A0D7BIN3_9AGAR|nr:hypothetical protein CYLTODRAFT_419774 [Cylindrobasidium torrendii FP15055 ss-10]